MSKKGWGSVVEMALIALKEEGPMTRIELSEHLGLPRDDLSVLSRMSKPQKTIPKLIHIAGWSRALEFGGYRRCLRPVYAVGNKPDAKKPPNEPNRIAGLRAYRKKRDMGRMNSIFNLGLSAKEAEQSQRKKAA
jgi:hypothetical protein